MKAITGIIQNGQIVADQPVNWPDGCRVVIAPVPEAAEETLGIREEDWPTDPEGIARLLSLIDQIEPLEMTPEEDVEWQADRQVRKEREKAHFDQWGRPIEELFE